MCLYAAAALDENPSPAGNQQRRAGGNPAPRHRSARRGQARSRGNRRCGRTRRDRRRGCRRHRRSGLRLFGRRILALDDFLGFEVTGSRLDCRRDVLRVFNDRPCEVPDAHHLPRRGDCRAGLRHCGGVADLFAIRPFRVGDEGVGSVWLALLDFTLVQRAGLRLGVAGTRHLDFLAVLHVVLHGPHGTGQGDGTDFTVRLTLFPLTFLEASLDQVALLADTDVPIGHGLLIAVDVLADIGRRRRRCAVAAQRDGSDRIPRGAVLEVILDGHRGRRSGTRDVRLREGERATLRERRKAVVGVMRQPLVEPHLAVDAVDQRARRAVADRLEVNLIQRAIVGDGHGPRHRVGAGRRHALLVAGDGHRRLRLFGRVALADDVVADVLVVVRGVVRACRRVVCHCIPCGRLDDESSPVVSGPARAVRLQNDSLAAIRQVGVIIVRHRAAVVLVALDRVRDARHPVRRLVAVAREGLQITDRTVVDRSCRCLPGNLLGSRCHVGRLDDGFLGRSYRLDGRFCGFRGSVLLSFLHLAGAVIGGCSLAGGAARGGRLGLDDRSRALVGQSL